MASILRVNTLTDASSNNSTAMSTINQGTAKAWINFNGAATGSVSDYDRDSFNISVTIDNGTGDYTLTATSAMSNDDYAGIVTGDADGVADFCVACTGDNSTARTTTVIRARTANTGGSPKDSVTISVLIFGDLA
jgi:hypothetical protein